MRTRTWLWAGTLGIGLTGFAIWSLSAGQDAPSNDPAKSGGDLPKSGVLENKPAADLSKFSVLKRQLYLSARRGAEWLQRAQRPDGRFRTGYLAALDRPIDEEDYFGQAGATAALGRSAAYFNDPRAKAQAEIAILNVLLLDTAVDPKVPEVRAPRLPAALVNRLGAAGMIATAIYQLPEPNKELLDKADQLCNFIRRTQQADGSLKWHEGEEAVAGPFQIEGASQYPGPALYAVALSQQARPAPWKIELLRKACAHYLPWWRQNKNPSLVPWHSAAYAEAYLQTKEPGFADAVFEMNDWLCTLQYQQADPRKPLWRGGFMPWQQGRAAAAPPTIQSAFLAGSLVEAWRVAHAAAQPQRLRSYRQALEGASQFVAAMQYTEANTKHFTSWYKEEFLLGGFHGSPNDGDLRLQGTHQAVAALVHVLRHVTDAETP
jgi:hypothetical protein